jgi:8-oxo-dGTP pyrophosphatase MutT (NUDIX family)
MTESEGWRRGAVLVPILAEAPHRIVFVERAPHLRRNPGQIAFPGGIAEPQDAGDPVKTALRELSEELGVGAERVKVVGRLPDLEQPSNRLVITPVVGVLAAGTRFAIDGDEIAGVFTVPLAAIVADATRKDAFDYEGRHIWGFTARVLKSFANAWSAPRSTLRARCARLR